MPGYSKENLEVVARSKTKQKTKIPAQSAGYLRCLLAFCIHLDPRHPIHNASIGYHRRPRRE